jgi:hypothetical protein
MNTGAGMKHRIGHQLPVSKKNMINRVREIINMTLKVKYKLKDSMFMYHETKWRQEVSTQGQCIIPSPGGG